MLLRISTNLTDTSRPPVLGTKQGPFMQNRKGQLSGAFYTHGWSIKMVSLEQVPLSAMSLRYFCFWWQSEVWKLNFSNYARGSVQHCRMSKLPIFDERGVLEFFLKTYINIIGLKVITFATQAEWEITLKWLKCGHGKYMGKWRPFSADHLTL